jgi:hypothetical protein
MSETNNDHQELQTAQKKKMHRQLDAIGWGLFFIWIGIAVLANLGWGIGLIGVGLIILLKLLAREYLYGSSSCKTTKASC